MTPPLNMAAFVAQSPSFRRRGPGRGRRARPRMELLDVDFPDTFSAYDGESAAEFLDRLRFPDGGAAPGPGGVRPQLLRRTRTTSPPASWWRCSTPTSWGRRRGCSSTCPTTTTTPRCGLRWAAISPASGSRCGYGERVTVGSLQADGVRVDAGFGGGDLGPAAVVLATDPGTTRELLLGAAVGDRALAAIGSRRRGPPRRSRCWRLWLDRPVDPARPPFLGTAASDRWTTSRCWSASRTGRRALGRSEHGGSVVELHAYALVEPSATSTRSRPGCGPSWHRIYPELTGAGGPGRGVAGQRRLPAGRHRPVARPADRRNPRPAASCWPVTASAATTRWR